MEQSYYNVMAPLEAGGALVYNVNRETMLELDRDERVAFEEFAQGKRALEDHLSQALAQEGMLVESAEAEAEALLYRHNLYRYNTRTFDLTIMPTRACNCACDYCYVNKHSSFMTQETQDLVMRFVEECYENAPFTKLRVSWYGGEPLLAIGVMEALSARLLDFCGKREIRYHGHMLTNGTLADKAMCERLVNNCGMVSVMPTISGDGRMHEWQRPLRDGSQYFDTFLANIDNMLEAGMLVRPNYVVNHNNF